MFLHYLKIATRNIKRYKVYSFLNISGLALGTTVCFLILLFVSYEWSFDSQIQDAHRVYRLYQKANLGEDTKLQALMMYPLAPTVQAEFPEVESYCRFVPDDHLLVKSGDKLHYLDRNYRVDSTALEIFNFPMRYGNPQEAFRQNNAVVLSAPQAQKIFGDINPLGKTLRISQEGEEDEVFQVSGVLQELPENSHLQFDALFSIHSLELSEIGTSWAYINNWLFTYLKLKENTEPASLEAKLPAMLDAYNQGENYKLSEMMELRLQPLSEVHLHSAAITLDTINFKKFDQQYLYIFLGLAALVLILAVINFINLSTARSVIRAKEIGIRKSIGARRNQLVFQLGGEAILYSLLAMFLAVLLINLCLPYLSQLTQRNLEFNPIQHPAQLVALLSMGVGVGALAGLYPALYISSYQPVKVLKGRFYRKKSKLPIRNVLVVSQFTIAVSLIILTLLVVEQLHYLRNKDLGFTTEQVVLLPFESLDTDTYFTFKESLKRNPEILQVTAANQRLGQEVSRLSFAFKVDSVLQGHASYVINVDADYLDFYGVELVRGEGLPVSQVEGAPLKYLINEAMAKNLSPDVSALPGRGFGFSWLDSLGQISGVIQDFHHNSLHVAVEPLVLVADQNWGYSEISVRLAPSQLSKGLARLEEEWNTFFPGVPFRYSFLDQHFDQVYQSEQRLSKVVGIFTFLSILVACLGLFGLAAFSTEQRSKEIGIRKVLGASIFGILSLMLKDFLRLVLLSFVLACPIAYLLARNWLQDYAFRINIGPEVFLGAGFGALAIASLTVIYHALLSARSNPVNVLRSE